MVIDHSNRLHESVTDGGTDKFEPGFFQRFGHYIGFGSAGGNLFQRVPLVDDRFAIDELPEIVAETVMLLQNFMEGAGIADSCLDLQPVTNDARVVQQLIDLALVVTALFDKDAAGQTGFSRRTVELIRERCVKEGLAAVKWKRCWWFTRDRKPPAILLLLNRPHNMSYSEPQASLLSRRVAVARVVPLARHATPRGERPKTPDRLIEKDRPCCARPRSALSKLAAGVLQRRFDALPVQYLNLHTPLLCDHANLLLLSRLATLRKGGSFFSFQGGSILLFR